MEIKFEQNKLLDSIVSFNDNLCEIRNFKKDFILKNELSSSGVLNFDNILYLSQISDFSKLKYINLNYDKISENISENFDECEETRDFYINKINVIRKLPIALIGNLEKAYFELLIDIEKAKKEKNPLLISKTFDLYGQKMKELSSMILEAWNEKSEKKLSSKYSALVSLQNPNFSCEIFEKIFKMIAEPMKNSFSSLINNSKYVKPQELDEGLLKNCEFLKNIDDFLSEYFDFNKFFEKNNLGHYFIYKNQVSLDFKEDFSLRKILNIKIRTILENLILNLRRIFDKKSDLNVFFSGFTEFENYHLISDFILNFYMTSQTFIEDFSIFIKKTSKVKGKAFDPKNLFWLLNYLPESNVFINDSKINKTEISEILFSMIQYVIEKDFINNFENLKLEDLISAWQNGMKRYFDAEVDQVHFLENFNFNPFEFGISGFKVFSILKSAEFHNKFFDENLSSSASSSNFDLEKEKNDLLFGALSQILNFEKQILPVKNDLILDHEEKIFSEYKKYLKNKFGIII